MDPNRVVSSVILRRKNSPDSPPFSATPLAADLGSYDVIDEHGNLLNDEALENLKQQQKEGISGTEPQGAATRARHEAIPAAPMANTETRHTEVPEVKRSTKAPEVTTASHLKEKIPTRRRAA